MNDILDEAASPGFAAPMAGLAREHPADIVERLNTKSIDIASAALSALPLERAAEVFDEPGLERAEELIEAQPPERPLLFSEQCRMTAQPTSSDISMSPSESGYLRSSISKPRHQ